MPIEAQPGRSSSITKELLSETSVKQAPGQFEIVGQCPATKARVGLLATAHGSISTPTFMPVGTQGTLKGLTPSDVARTGVECALANTYHLVLRPGAARIAALGGLHRFMGWSGAILTDSGGYQVFSLGNNVRLDDRGVTFYSHLNGRPRRFTPEMVINWQEQLGADIIMPLDVCLGPEATRPEVERALQRTEDWATRSQNAHERHNQLLFGIIQGGLHADLRQRAADSLAARNFSGYAIGGLSVGEHHRVTTRLVLKTTEGLPFGRPRYLMGVGTPVQVALYPALGVDLFDCVLPTRLGRIGVVFEGWRTVNLTRPAASVDVGPISAGCRCIACRFFPRAVLYSMFRARTGLAFRLASLHNLTYLADLVARVRQAILAGSYSQFILETLHAISPAASGAFTDVLDLESL